MNGDHGLEDALKQESRLRHPIWAWHVFPQDNYDTTFFKQRLLWIENILTMILHLTVWGIFLDEADGGANGVFKGES